VLFLSAGALGSALAMRARAAHATSDQRPDVGEYLPRHGDLGYLEGYVAAECHRIPQRPLKDSC
jgi:hypothetical protein